MPSSTLCNRGHQVEGIVFSCQSCPPVDWGCNETSSHSIVSLTQQIYRYEVAKQKCLGTLLYQAVYCYLFRGIRDGYIFRVLQLTFLDISYNMAKKNHFLSSGLLQFNYVRLLKVAFYNMNREEWNTERYHPR